MFCGNNTFIFRSFLEFKFADLIPFKQAFTCFNNVFIRFMSANPVKLYSINVFLLAQYNNEILLQGDLHDRISDMLSAEGYSIKRSGGYKT